MNIDSFLGILHNLALLLAACFLYQLVTVRWESGKGARQKVFSGLVVGGIGVLIMLTPWRFSPGIFFDSRSVLLSVSGLFFGPLTTVVAMLITALFRTVQGGAGTLTGLMVIASSGLIGILWRQARKTELARLTWMEMFGMGVMVHVVMLLLMVTLPWSIAMNVFSQIALPVIIVNSVGVALVGSLLSRHLANQNNAHAVAEREERFRGLFENNHAVMLIIDPENGAIKDANPAASDFYGWSRDVLRTMKIGEINCLSSEEVKAEMKRAKNEERRQFFFQHALSDGSVRDVEVFTGPISVEGRALLYSIIHDITERRIAEEALRDSERKYRNIFENAQEGIFQSFAAGRFITVNPAMARMCGYETPEEMVETITDIGAQYYVDPGVRGPFLLEVEKKGSLENFECKVRHKDGFELWVSTSSRVIRDSEGRVEFFEGMVVDITDRKRAEEAIRQSEEKFRATFESAPVGMALVGLDGTLLTVNPAFSELLGYTEEELLDFSFNDFTHPDDREEGTERFRLLAEKRENIQWAEKRYLHKNGDIIWTTISNTVVKNNQGSPFYVVSFLIDSTKIRKVEKSLRESEEKYRSVMEAANEPIIVYDTLGQASYINPAFTRVFGWTPSEVLGKKLDYVPEEEKKRTREHLALLNMEGKTSGFETRRLTKGGEVLDISISAAVFRDNEDRILGTVVNLNDISEIKRAEKELRKNEAFLQGFFRAAPAGLGMSKDRKFLMVNEQLADITGYSVEELTGMEAKKLYFNESDYLASGEEYYGQVRDRGFASCEARWRTKDGMEIDVLMNAAPVSPQSAPTEIVFAVLNITEKKDREKLYHLLFEQANDAIILMQDMVFIDCNTRTLEMYGVKREDFIGRTPMDFSEPTLSDGKNSGKSAEEKVANAMKGQPQSFEWRHVRPNGTFFDAEVSLSRVDMSGQAFIQAIVRDITKRKQAEEALRQSELRFQALSDATFESIFLSDKGLCIDQNLTAERMFGYTPEEAFGKPGTDWVAFQDRELVKNQLMSGNENPYEITALRKDGSTFPAEIQSRTLDKQDRKIRVTALRNITDRKKAEEALRKSEDYLASIFRAVPTGLSVHEGRVFTMLNERITEITGYSREDLLGHTTRILYFSEQEYQRAGERISEQIRDRGLASNEVRLRHKSGREIQVIINSAALWHDEENPIIIHSILDITERKKAEEALKNSEDYLASIFTAVPTGIVVTKNRVLTLFNSRISEITGYPKEILLGSSTRILYVSEKEFLRAGEVIYKQINDSGYSSTEALFRHENGREIHVLITSAALRHSQEEGLSVHSILDITERKKAEQELEREKLFSETLLESLPGIFYMFNQNGELIRWNKTMEIISGYDFDDLNRKYVLDWFADEEKELIAKAFQKVFVGRDVRIEANLVIKNGKKIPFYFVGSPFQKGFERLLIGVGLNITEAVNTRKELERYQEHLEELVEQRTRELRDSEERYRTILESMEEGYYEVDLAGSLTFFNDSFCGLLGYHRQELVGMNIREYSTPEEAKRILKIFNKISQTGHPEKILDYEIIRKDGQKRIIEASASPRRDLSGPLIGFRGVARDITERKATEKALRDSEAFSKSVIESSPDCIKVLNELGYLTYMSPGGRTLLEVENVNQFIGLHYLDFWRETKYFNLMSQTLAAALSGNPGKAEGYLPTAKGTPKWWSISFTPIRHQKADDKNLLIVSRDITAIKEAEQRSLAAKEAAEAANHSKSEFLANMSHEIRTPMNAVIGMSELLLTTPLTGKQKYFAGAISDAAGALLIILDDILDFSKIQAGKLNLENVPFDLREVVEQVGQILAVRAQGKDIEVLVRYPIDLPSRYIGDPTRIRQILMNLAGNAVKFTEKGYVLLEVLLQGKEYNQCGLHFSITDTGIGIAPEQLEFIFEKFSQADESTTRKYGGTGLGLAICKKLVEMMGGSIGAESKPGQGSVFSFNLILPCSDESDPEIALDMDLTHVRVLVVDDNERNREIALEYLQLRSVPSEAFDSGESALAGLREAKMLGRPFNLAILDHHMPGMDGGELALTIKNDPEIKETVLVLLSSFMPVDELAPETRACFAGGINKPIKVSLFFETLLEVWNTYLGGEPKRVTSPISPRPSFQPLDFEPRVLLVEDSRMNRQVAMEILKRFGCRVDVAANGLEAVQRWEAAQYDLVFMDIHMPVMDGFEAACIIREKEGDTRHTPIVAMTALAMQGDREKCLDAGMDDYIAKPIRSGAVRDVLLKNLAPRGVKIHEDIQNRVESGPEHEMVLNPNNLVDISGRDPEIIEALINEYLRDAPLYLEELQTAVRAEDPDQIYKKSHRLQGLAANAGGERVRSLLVDIEHKIRQGKYIPDIIDLVPLESEMKHLRQALLEMDWKNFCETHDT